MHITSVSRRGVALAAAVLTLGLATGAAASTSLRYAERDAASAALALRTATVRGALGTSLQRYADTVHDLAGAAATQPLGTLAATVARLAGGRLDGAQQILVVDAARTVVARHALDGSTPPADATLTAGPELAQAMELAHTTGRLTAGRAHPLAADAGLPPAHRQPGFDLAEAVHTDAGLRGWVIVTVRGGDLLEQSLHTAGVTGVAAALAEVSPDGRAHEFATWSDGHPGAGAPRRTAEIAVAGHAWQVAVRATGAVAGPVAGLFTMLGAVLVSVLIAAAVLLLDAARTAAAGRAGRERTARRAAAERARLAERALTDLRAELTGFAATAGRHLHTPLHTIAGYTDLLLEDAAPQLDEASRGFLDRIARSTRRMLGVVDDLLLYTATTDTVLAAEPVDTERLTVDAVAARLDACTGERPSVDVGDLPLVSGDAHLLGQVLDQLIGNAVRFTRHGTPARITVSAHELPSGWYRFEVADRGIGVPEEHRERIFAPFHRAPGAEGYPGSGLGLAACRRIVALHGGQTGMRANPGGGSVFWFTLSAAGVTLSPDDLTALAAA